MTRRQPLCIAFGEHQVIGLHKMAVTERWYIHNIIATRGVASHKLVGNLSGSKPG